MIYEFCRNGKFRIQIEISFCSRWPALQAIMNEKLKTGTRRPVGVETMKQPEGNETEWKFRSPERARISGSLIDVDVLIRIILTSN